jgi:hypothetical protein
MDEMDGSVIITVEPAGSRTNREQQPGGWGSRDRQLAARFLMGLLLLGGDELLRYLQAAQREIEAAAEAPGQVVFRRETERDLLAYLALGILAQGQKRVVRGVRRGIRYSVGAAGWAFGAMDWLTDNPLGRPIRGSIGRRLSALVQEGERVVRESQREAQSARLLASRTVGVMVSDVVAEVAESPEVTETIQQIVGQQSVELAGTMMDSARQLSAGADSRAEGLVRRLFRRRPRRELPPSPLAGKPQTMYLSWDEPREGEKDDRPTGT